MRNTNLRVHFNFFSGIYRHFLQSYNLVANYNDISLQIQTTFLEHASPRIASHRLALPRIASTTMPRRALHDETLRLGAAATVKEALRDYVAAEPSRLERFGIVWFFGAMVASAYRMVASAIRMVASAIRMVASAIRTICAFARPITSRFAAPEQPAPAPAPAVKTMKVNAGKLPTTTISPWHHASHNPPPNLPENPDLWRQEKAQRIRVQGAEKHEPRMGEIQAPEQECRNRHIHAEQEDRSGVPIQGLHRGERALAYLVYHVASRFSPIKKT